MTHYTKNHGDLGPGVRSSQANLQDRREGTYDRVGKKPAHPMREHDTPHEEAQPGAPVRPETEPRDTAVPEGLQRERKGPLSPSRGRGEEPSQVPSWKPDESK